MKNTGIENLFIESLENTFETFSFEYNYMSNPKRAVILVLLFQGLKWQLYGVFPLWSNFSVIFIWIMEIVMNNETYFMNCILFHEIHFGLGVEYQHYSLLRGQWRFVGRCVRKTLCSSYDELFGHIFYLVDTYNKKQY